MPDPATITLTLTHEQAIEVYVTADEHATAFDRLAIAMLFTEPRLVDCFADGARLNREVRDMIRAKLPTLAEIENENGAQ